MRVTSLNLWGLNKWHEREGVIVDYLKDVDSDIVLFQEDVYLPDISKLSPVQLLARHLNLRYRSESISRLQSTPEGKPYREGLGVLSRYPILESEVISLLRDPRDGCQRLAQLIDIDTPEGVLKLANIHLSVTDDHDFATPQLAEVLSILRSRGEVRTIAGDFNVHGMDGLAQHRQLWDDDYHLADEHEYVSFPGTNDRLDYFLLPKSHSVESFEVSPDGLSDHRAITIDLQENVARQKTNILQSLPEYKETAYTPN